MRVVRDTEGMTGDRERQADTIRQEYWRVGPAGYAPQECLPLKRIRMSMRVRYAVSPGYQGANRSSNNCYSVFKRLWDCSGMRLHCERPGSR